METIIQVSKKAQDEQGYVNYVVTPPKTPSMDDPARFTVGDYNKLIELSSTLMGTNYLMVYGTGTPTENATELQTVYNAAKAKSPSATNVITIVVAPGNYDFGAKAFVHDTAYIDIVSLTGDADVFLKSVEIDSALGYKYGIKVTANNTLVKGINCDYNTFYIANSLYYLTCINCKGGNYSFGSGTVSGTFTNCTGGDYSFGGNGGTASGTFTDCKSGYQSFGYLGIASGVFINCKSDEDSFGGYGTASGTFINCKGDDGSFGGSHGTASGIFTNCTGNYGSFGGYGTVSGTFTNCTGSYNSFGGNGGTITTSARLYYCILTNGAFPTPASGGKIIDCVDSTGNVNNGTNYLMVHGIGTPTENATALQTVYNAAKKMLPSVTNVITIVVAPGNYDFSAKAFVHDTAYIDIVSLTGDADVFLKSSEYNSYLGNNYGIKVTANNTLVKGINCGTNTFYIANSLNYLTCINCIGGNYSFGGTGIASGTFKDCIGSLGSFGGGGGTASGTFINCTGGAGSFGNDGGVASGTFTNCTGGIYSFGGQGTASGTFKDCTGGDNSFGGHGTASGTFINCIGGDVSFACYGTASGIFTNCTGGNSSFGYNGTASGTFKNCTGGDSSFACYHGYASGTFISCIGGVESFGGMSGNASGTFKDCIGGDKSFGGHGTTSGIFINCTGGNDSFGAGGGITSSARLYYCKLTSGTFTTPDSGGKIVLCIDGSDNVTTI
jgi:hypothetical protein